MNGANSVLELLGELARLAGVRELRLVDPDSNIFEDQYGRRIRFFRVNRNGFLKWTFKFL
jgi:hypothetical protein